MLKHGDGQRFSRTLLFNSAKYNPNYRGKRIKYSFPLKISIAIKIPWHHIKFLKKCDHKN
ncbi:hypothetical protein SAMN06265784_107299 [Paraburkholderia susongensis]|uniref:Uncharacterized protein n=1 Tax=Paraburkholderia susongensis TaxID=1515439 RepID=A0A1X7LRD9_9BURK|nr:hypothetical protein SAMN06265784_107299 [Paraburkholderia susongensis]